MDFIEAFVSKVHKLSPNSLELFKGLVKERIFSKGEKLASTGEVPTKFYILKSGVARSYTTDENGKEHIQTLFVPITTSGDLAALIKNKPSEYSYDCITDCVFLEGNYKAFIELAQKHLDISVFYAKILELIFLKVVKRIHELSILNATERYLKLKNEIPEIENLIQQYHIAAYLSITPVQLSRIRKELYSK